MSILKKLDEKVKQVKQSPFNLIISFSKNEMEEIFGENFLEEAISEFEGEKAEYQLFFEEDKKIYRVIFENFHPTEPFKLLSRFDYSTGELVFYLPVNDEMLKNLKEELESLEKRQEKIEKVLNHPLNRVKKTFL